MAGKKAKDLKDGLDLIAGEKGVIKSAKSAFSAITTVSKYSLFVQKFAYWQTVVQNMIKSVGGVLGCSGVSWAKGYRPKACGTLRKWGKASDKLAEADREDDGGHHRGDKREFPPSCRPVGL